MSQIIKSSSGLLYKEEDWNDISLLWDISPNFPDRIVIKDDSISLLPGTTRMELLLNTPKENGYVMQSQIKYNPVTQNDGAGCMFKSVTDNIIELEARGDNSETYKYSKLIIDDNNILDAKASLDGNVWIDYGNTKLIDMNKLGFYIDDEADETPIVIKDFVLYKNNYIFFNNIEYSNKIKIFDCEDNEITDKFIIKKRKNQICIDGTNFIFPIECIKIKIYDKQTDELLSESILEDVYGGDVYDYECDIEFYINDDLLDNNIYDLGNLRRENNYTLTIVNKEKFDIKNKKLFVTYYSAYNPGYKFAKISPENKNEYSDELSIDLLTGETKKFDLKVKRDDYINVDEKYMFNIVLE